MTPDSEGLHEITNTTNRDRKADLVFVHGLGGASHSTWRHGKQGQDGHFFWPEELGQDLPDCAIWTVGYPAGFTALGKPGMIIEKRAGNLSQKLANAGLGSRPLLFITHSMGGLVVKSLIVGSQTLADPDRKRIVSAIRGIVFCATPHRGSAFADAAGVLGEFFGGSQDHVDEMRANAEPLDILHDQFIEWHRNHPIPVDSYAENIGLFRTRWWGRPLPLGLVVPRASANPGIAGHTVRDVDDDHLTLVKPKDRQHDVYAGVKRLIEVALTNSAQITRPAPVAKPAAATPAVRDLIYISYSKDDADWHHQLRKVLDADPQLRDRIWDDTHIAKTENWQLQIPQHLARAKVVVMLASPSYFDPHGGAYMWEMMPAVEAERRGELRIAWFAVRACDFTRSPIGHVYASLTPEQPLDTLRPADQQKALGEIHRLIRELLGLEPLNPQSAQSTITHTAQIRNSNSTITCKAEISHINKYAPAELIGREAETKLLADAWDKAVRGEPKRPHVLTFVALGGEGKTSLVAKWAAELAHRDWPGCEVAFAWSFYSQGTREQTAISSDAFLAEALTFFGDAAMAGTAQSAFEKGRRLARHVGERRALLILDGLEPLQYAPTSPTPGELKDQGLAALLKGLAATSLGLCVVTTRYALPDLRAFSQTTSPVHELPRLSTAAGVKLLRTIGVKTGSQADFEKLVEDVDGHALTLQILGQFLVRAFHGDIRRRDRINFEKADAKIQGGHAFRAMEAYVKWLEDDSEEARREVALLKLLGLFDRPATADCVAALRQAPAIPGLTEPLVGLAEDDWEFSLSALRDAKLLTVNREEGSGVLVALDAHPLLREYFGSRLRRQQPEAWRAAHRRLYEHLCATTKDLPQPTLEDLQPLYQAVAHGCQAGLQEEARAKVYRDRIQRGKEAYSKFSAMGSDLGAIACFFETPWSRVSPAVPEDNQGWLLNEAAFCLRALGRLTEAVEPMRAGLENYVKQENWSNAAGLASNLSELELRLGEVAGAVGNAEQSVTYADRGGDAEQRLRRRGILGDALFQAGRSAEALPLWQQAERMHAEGNPRYPFLYSTGGFRYCDLLLIEAERAAWQVTCSGVPRTPEDGDAHRAKLQAVSERAAQTLKWAGQHLGLLSIALDHLTLGRAALYAAILESSRSDFRVPRSELDLAVDGLRRAGTQDMLVLGPSPAPGCVFSKPSRPAPRAHRATWTKPGKSPSAAP